MDYKVLYRKYRPDDFTNIVGQEYITSILKNTVLNNKISHAYIFSGPRGTGKTSTAKVFAKAINCLHPTAEGPCNNCESCKQFASNADIIEIDAASNNGVDEIREIINNVKLAPSYSKYKVYIIDEVHMLSTSAFNALLLTLEEPPKHIVFILATTNIEAVPITILSRAQRFDFHKISTSDIVSRLEYIAKEENIQIESEAIEEIADLSDGGMRDALSILDQLCGSDLKITADDVIKHFGSVSKKQIDSLFDSIYKNDISKFLKIMATFKDLATDYKLMIRKCLEKIESEAIKSKSDLKYQGITYQDLKEMAFELASISNYISVSVEPYMLIEIALLKYFKNTNYIEKKDNFITVEKKEKTPPQFENYDNLINIRINNCFVNAKKEYLQEIQKLWPEYISSLKDKKLLNILIDSSISAASDKVIVITNNSAGTANLINEKLELITKEFNNKFNLQYIFIALSNDRWQIERQKYINNIKNKVCYKIIDEPQVAIAEENKSANIEEVALNIFDSDKIEME